jgi:hypothetical protein
MFPKLKAIVGNLYKHTLYLAFSLSMFRFILICYLYRFHVCDSEMGMERRRICLKGSLILQSIYLAPVSSVFTVALYRQDEVCAA